jgi:hypothetical protein
MTQIYLDDETKFILNRIKHDDDKFNLSNFVQTAISNHVGLGTEDINKLYKKIADNRTRMDFLANENVFLENKINEINHKQKSKEERKAEEEREFRVIEKASEFIKTMTKEQHKEFIEGYPSKWKTKVDYYKAKCSEESI